MSDSAPQPPPGPAGGAPAHPDDNPELDAQLRRPFFTREGQLRERLTPLQKKWIILVLTLVMFTHTMDFMVLMPLGPRLMTLFQISPQQFSFLVSAYSFTAGIFGFFGSLVFDRLDRKHALIGTYLGFLIGTFSCALAPSFPILLAARALSGAFGGLLAGIAFAIVGDLFAIHERGAATGKLMTSFSLAAIIGVPIGLILSTNFGWHAPFFTIVGIGIFAMITILKVIPNVSSHLKSHYSGIFSGLTENFSDPNSRRALMTTFMMVLSQFVVVPFISPYLVSNTGFPEQDLPLVYLLGGAFTAFSGPMIGKLCDRATPRKIFTRTGLLFLIPMFAITHLGVVPAAVVLLATTSFFALSNARMVPAMTIIQSSIPPSRRGSFMSLNSCIQQLGSASASFASGWVITQIPGTVFIQGFSETAYLSIIFGVFAYLFGRSIRMVS